MAFVAGAALVAAACGSGESILNAGNEATTTVTTAPPATAAPGETLAPTTSTLPPTTTTTPLDALAPCPLAALDDVGAPDYSDDGMLQYLRAERIIPPYQTRGYKLVELVRIYEVGTPSRA